MFLTAPAALIYGALSLLRSDDKLLAIFALIITAFPAFATVAWALFAISQVF